MPEDNLLKHQTIERRKGNLGHCRVIDPVTAQFPSCC
jgi:hypothetical protein